MLYLRTGTLSCGGFHGVDKCFWYSFKRREWNEAKGPSSALPQPTGDMGSSVDAKLGLVMSGGSYLAVKPIRRIKANGKPAWEEQPTRQLLRSITSTWDGVTLVQSQHQLLRPLHRYHEIRETSMCE